MSRFRPREDCDVELVGGDEGNKNNGTEIVAGLYKGIDNGRFVIFRLNNGIYLHWRD